jgi:hypothetical protein
MFMEGVGLLDRPGEAAGPGWVTAAEREPGYDARPPGARFDPGSSAGGLAGCVEGLAASLEALGGAEVDAETDTDLLAAAVGLQRLAERLAAQQLRVLGAVERREAYGRDGAVTAASWLRERTGMDHGRAVSWVEAARRLPRLPELQAALLGGEVSFAHVTAVTRAAVPTRMDVIASFDGVLADLARNAPPHAVRRAVARIREYGDPDGCDTPPLDEHGLDERRFLDVFRGIDGLVEGRFSLDQVQGEALLTVIDAFDAPDPAETLPGRRRSAGQRRADALAVALRTLLDRADTPVVQGNRPHLTLTVDVETLIGLDDLAARKPRLRHTGELDGERARALARHASVQAVLLLGPWRPVNVGRAHRTLPGWLRWAFEVVHRHCRGPDCNRPITWTEAHHILEWAAEHGITDINQMVPLCQAHHQLVTVGGWHVGFDPDNGVCTWTGPAGQVIHTYPSTP